MVKQTLIALVLLLVIDFIWLALIAKGMYANNIGSLMKTDVNWIAAGLFYIIYSVALVIFVINPSIEKQSLSHALLFGAFFGMVAYSTYDLSNLATLKNWPILVTVVDIAWGSFISSVVSVITFLIVK